MRHSQLECGLSQPFYSYDFYKIQHFMTPTWITNLWQYTTKCHCRLHEQFPWRYLCPRAQDKFIMHIVTSSDMPQEHQEIFNRVRINLCLLTLSDIVVADSPTRILPDIFKGINHRTSSLNWPTQQKLPTEWMNIFQQTLRDVIMPHLQNNSLGRWLHDGH